MKGCRWSRRIRAASSSAFCGEMRPSVQISSSRLSISVSSPGADAPLKLPRQYAKHVGRELKVTLDEGEPLVGTLSRSDDQGIVLEWTTREPKPVGKGKHTVLHTQSIPYGDIRKACVVLKF